VIARLALVALMLTASCTPTDLRRKVLRSWGEDLLLPLYVQFDARLGELAVRIEALCSTPTEETLALAREGWWNARAPWKQAEVFAFGPFSEEPLRLGPKIDFWPARPENADEVLAGSDPITAETFGAASKGLPIVEYLLYAFWRRRGSVRARLASLRLSRVAGRRFARAHQRAERCVVAGGRQLSRRARRGG